MFRIIVKAALVLLCMGAAASIIYFAWLRPWLFTRGASAEEAKMALPGDSLVQVPNVSYTQAVTINAPKEIVWAYLKQIGYKRAGWYNIDQINGMIKDYFYEGGKSATRIIPELQDLKVGDDVAITPQLSFKVREIRENSCLLLEAAEGEGNERRELISWVYSLKENGDKGTRLVVRWRSCLFEGISGRILNFVFNEIGSAGLQQPAMLKGIKRRAEAEAIKH